MKRSFIYLLYTILATVIYFPIPVIIGETYFNHNWKNGAIVVLGNEMEIIVYGLIGFFVALLFFLLFKLFNSRKKMVKDVVRGYLYSSIYVFILLTTISCIYFLRL
jgi:hypothetical protein